MKKSETRRMMMFAQTLQPQLQAREAQQPQRLLKLYADILAAIPQKYRDTFVLHGDDAHFAELLGTALQRMKKDSGRLK